MVVPTVREHVGRISIGLLGFAPLDPRLARPSDHRSRFPENGRVDSEPQVNTAPKTPRAATGQDAEPAVATPPGPANTVTGPAPDERAVVARFPEPAPLQLSHLEKRPSAKFAGSAAPRSRSKGERNKSQQIGYCQTQRMVVLTMLYNLRGQPMTVLEHTRLSLQSAQGRRGSGVFH